MNFHRHRKEPIDINITPMIDVVFLLLIFFMVTTTFNRETELKVTLPEAQGTEKPDAKVLEITIDGKGVYYVNKKEVINSRLETLKKAIKLAAEDSKNIPVVINADAKTPHQSVISALDAAGQLGLVHISFATKAPPENAQ